MRGWASSAIVATAVFVVAACNPSDGTRELVWSIAEEDFWRDTRGYSGTGEGRILITNNLSDSVSILDLAKVGSDELRELTRVPVGLIPVEREGPHHVTAEPGGEHYYIGISNYVPGSGSGPHGVHGSGTAAGHVLKIRASDNLTIASARVDRNPGDVRLTPDGKRLVVTHFDLLRITEAVTSGAPPEAMDARMIIVDTDTMRITAEVKICPAPHGVAIPPDGRFAYASCLSDEMVQVDLVADTHPVRRFFVIPNPGSATAPMCFPYALTISPSGDSVWVSCSESGEVLRFDVAAGAMDPARRTQLPGPALFGTFTKDGRTLIVPHQSPDGIAFIDPDTSAPVALLPLPRAVCVNAHVVRLTDDERRLLLVCEGDHSGPGTLVVLDAATRAIERTVSLGRYPDDIAFLRGAP